ARVGGWGISTGGNETTVPVLLSDVASSQTNGKVVPTASRPSPAYCAAAAICRRRALPDRNRAVPGGRGIGSVIGKPSFAEQPEAEHGEADRHHGQDHAQGGRVSHMEGAEGRPEQEEDHRVGRIHR